MTDREWLIICLATVAVISTACVAYYLGHVAEAGYWIATLERCVSWAPR